MPLAPRKAHIMRITSKTYKLDIEADGDDAAVAVADDEHNASALHVPTATAAQNASYNTSMDMRTIHSLGFPALPPTQTTHNFPTLANAYFVCESGQGLSINVCSVRPFCALLFSARV